MQSKPSTHLISLPAELGGGGGGLLRLLPGSHLTRRDIHLFVSSLTLSYRAPSDLVCSAGWRQQTWTSLVEVEGGRTGEQLRDWERCHTQDRHYSPQSPAGGYPRTITIRESPIVTICTRLILSIGSPHCTHCTLSLLYVVIKYHHSFIILYGFICLLHV